MTTSPAALADRPLDVVVFDAATLVNPTEPGPDGVAWPRQGARRLVAALASRGVAVHVPPAIDRPDAADALARHLSDAGFPAGALTVATPADGGTARRTLVVTRRPDPDPPAALVGAPVLVCGDRPVHRAVFGWLADEAGPFAAAALLAGPPDARAAAAARDHHLRLTKPPGSLGRLEDIGALLAGIAGTSPPPLPRPAAVAVFAGDHGVHAQGVSPWPQEVTAQMVGNLLDGGAAINVLARQAGADVAVVDVGVATPLDPRRGLVDANVRRGTADLTVGPAMTRDEAGRALDAGAAAALRLVAGGAACLVTGDMGIANTTPSAALVASLTDLPATEVTGRGTGIDDDLLTRKTALVAAAAARARYAHGDDALAVLAEVGGLEHAALAGLVVAAAALQVPVIVDGVIAAAALLVASRLVPGVEACVIAGHRSVEPGSSAVLDALGLDPVIDLDLRLGEGTGAALALPVVEAAVRVLREMATFDEAGVSDKR
ncbi:MAG TPA: nicotinate-nucleotide--dimethylbenzimidazole phosphoribosyltransferase [Acidimicrobiales bacterium]|nr:nicotinate-nucleotide--dimethylbenzimidazole phosphoribosyltransferase [Acidimicrobiales bacterium]